jgi:hypothetical protein
MGGWTATWPRATAPSVPTAPARLAIHDATQRLTASARTEPLLRHAGANGEENIAAWPLTRLPHKICRIRGWVLALVRRRRLQLRDFSRRCPCQLSGHLILDVAQRRFPVRRPLLSSPLPIAARLLLSALLAPLTAPVGPRAPPPLPASGLLTAVATAIPLLRLPRMERSFTALEQTAPLPKPVSRGLSRIGRRLILREAHGSG